MGDGVGAGLFGDFHQAFCDERAGDGGAEQIFAFIYSVAAHHREDKVAYEFFLQVFYVDVLFLDPEFQGAGARFLHFFALSYVGGEGQHFALVFQLQPLEDGGGVKPTRVGEDYF